MPKTKYGKWSVGLIITMFVLFVIGSYITNTLNDSAPTEDTIYTYSISRSVLDISMHLAFSAGIAAFVNGLISIFDQKERGALVFASTIVGAAFTFFYVINLLFPR